MKAGRAIERLEAGKADAVGLVREPFVPSAKAAAETLEVLARRGAVATGDADELARLLLALRPAIPLVLGWFAVSSPGYRLARAVELLTAERAAWHAASGTTDPADVLRATLESDALLDARDAEIVALRARVAELERTVRQAQSGERLLRAQYQEQHDARRAAECRIAELEASPTGASVAGLLAKIEAASQGAADLRRRYVSERELIHEERQQGRIDAFDEAASIIRSTLSAPSPADDVVADVLALPSSVIPQDRGYARGRLQGRRAHCRDGGVSSGRGCARRRARARREGAHVVTRVSVEGPRIEADITAEQVVAYLLREGWIEVEGSASYREFERNGRIGIGVPSGSCMYPALALQEALVGIARAESRPAADVLAAIVWPTPREVVGNGSAVCEEIYGQPERERLECYWACLDEDEEEAPAGAEVE